MDHIADYVKRNRDIPFGDKPFNEVDALVLAQFSYMKWEGLIPGLRDNSQGVTLLDLDAMMDPEQVFMDERYAKDNRELWTQMIAGRRYQNMICNYFADRFDEDIETQFCAFVVFPEGALPVVLYRGTDETILGWKEDFNMAFSRPVPGQRLALMYLRQVALRLSGHFALSGHSKGGNFAVYAAMNVDAGTKRRIVRVYDFDGPGFRPEVLKESQYNTVKKKIDKMIPTSSLVGMLFENHEDYSVVRSSAVGGVPQHNPYTWNVVGDEFCWDEDVKKRARVKSKSINKFVLSLSEDKVKLVGDTLFGLLDESDTDSLLDFVGDPGGTSSRFLKAMYEVDRETADEIKEIFKDFPQIATEELKSVAKNADRD